MQRLIRGVIAAILTAALLVTPALAAPPKQDATAIITSPTDGQQVSGLVQIFGTVTAGDFSRYEIAYGPDPNPGDSWVTFASAQILLTNAQIGLWDANLPPGIYALRLRVYRSDGGVAAEDFVNGLIIGEPPTPTPAATPTDVPPAPTFESETQATIQPTIVIEQPPTSTPEPAGAAGSTSDASSSSQRGDSGLDLGRFTGAFVDGATCAVGAFFVLGAIVAARWGVRLVLKQVRERSNE